MFRTSGLCIIQFLATTGVMCGIFAASSGNASAQVVDGFSVTFNALPTADITTGLTPNSLLINGAPYPVSTLVYPGGAGFSELSSNPWGAANPFQYSATLNGSVYAGIWNGAATYNYTSPQSDFSILWGTIDYNNAVDFFGQNGTPLGTLVGADLATAAALYDPNYTWANGVDITVQISTPYYSLVTIGGPNLTFEYANLVSASGSVPEPSTIVLLGVGLAALFFVSAWRHFH